MTNETTSGISRRTLAKGAAWAVPAVAVASAAPVMAKSGVPLDPTYSPDSFCKHPGGGTKKYYHGRFCFNNTSTMDITVYFDTFSVNTETKSIIQPTSLTVPAGEECCVNVDGYPFGDSQNGTGVVAFHYTYMGNRYDDTVSTGPQDLPPCQQLLGQDWKDYKEGDIHIDKLCD